MSLLIQFIYLLYDLYNVDNEASWRFCMERDFQDGTTARNKIAFRNIMWRQRDQDVKRNQRGLHYPPLHFSISENVIFPVKES